MAGPLVNLRVIEASYALPGAIAAMLLADHGAEVIKVEPPGGGPFAHDLTRKTWDRGKASVELDWMAGAGLPQLKELLTGADLLIHSLEPADAARLGLDEDSLAATCPGLVVCALTAYGQNTPFAGRPYGESLAAACLGTMVDKGSSFRPGPVYLGHPALHYGQAFLAVIGGLAALRARGVIGAGQQVEVSLLDSMLAQSPMNNWWQEDGISYIKKGDSGALDRFGRTRLVTAMFECSDGLFLQMHTGGPGGFRAAMEVLGFGDKVQQIKGPEMAVPLDDEEYQIARVDIFERFKTRPRDEWIALFHAADVAALPVLEPAQVLLDSQTQHARMCIGMPDKDYGTIRQAAPALRFSACDCLTPSPAPMVGADNHRLAGFAARPAPQPVRGGALASPLQGLRVIDFSSFFAVGYGGRLLNDLGADVIKVETPDGDQMRPLPDVFDAAQRGKRDIVLNLKSQQGLEAALKLVETADIVTHNLRPGKADKLGIGWDALSAVNSRLIYAYMPGYGSSGPKSLLKSFAPLVSGWTGLLYEGGGEGNPPTRSVFGNEDYNNGFLAAAGILMAVLLRERTGTGTYMECPQLHSSLWTTSEHFLDADGRTVYGFRLDQRQEGIHALDRIYPVMDGWVCICCRDDRRFAALAQAIGKPALPLDIRFVDVQARNRHDAELQALIAPVLAGLTKAEAIALLDSAGAAAEPVRETSWVQEALWEDWALQSNRVIENHDSMYGHVRQLGQFIHLSRTPGGAKGSAPRLGEHTREILAEAGYSADAIETLLADGHARQAQDVSGRIATRVSAA